MGNATKLVVSAWLSFETSKGLSNVTTCVSDVAMNLKRGPYKWWMDIKSPSKCDETTQTHDSCVCMLLKERLGDMLDK